MFFLTNKKSYFWMTYKQSVENLKDSTKLKDSIIKMILLTKYPNDIY